MPCPARACTSTSSTAAPDRIQYKKVSAEDGEEVPSEAITKGYQLSSGDYVLVGDDELAALDPEANRTIDIEQFVDLAEIDPLFYDSAYYVAPDKAARKPYALLAQAMEREEKVAIARFVMRSKQYLAALRPKDGVLVLSTMVYADEVNDPLDLGEIEDAAETSVSDKELKMAAQLIESLTEPFAADQFQDNYRNQVLDLVERKASGEEEVVAAPGAQVGGEGGRPHGRPRGLGQGGQGLADPAPHLQGVVLVERSRGRGGDHLQAEVHGQVGRPPQVGLTARA